MFLDLPCPGSTPTSAEYAAAKRFALAALKHDNLSDYYRVSGDYAGTTFRTLGVVDPACVDEDDLCAVTLLGVTVSPRGVRHLINPGAHREAVQSALGALAEASDLRSATAGDFVKMWHLQAAIKAAIADPHTKKASNPWVTAAKISARKRPGLVAVRDRVVGGKLGERALNSAYVYWQLMRALLLDTEVTASLDRARECIAREAAGDLQHDFRHEPDLRLLDAALWMHVARPTGAQADE
jgi:hypothetical protein